MPGIVRIDEAGEEIIEWEIPSQEEINLQDTEFLRSCFGLFNRFKVCGLPGGSGYLKERNVVIDIITILEGESARFDSWQMKFGKDLEDT